MPGDAILLGDASSDRKGKRQRMVRRRTQRRGRGEPEDPNFMLEARELM